MRIAAPALPATRSSPMSSPLIFMPNDRTSAAVDGHGTPDQRGGCIGPASSGFWGFVCGNRSSISIRASHARGEALRSHSAITRRAMKSSSRIRRALREAWRRFNSMANQSQEADISNSPMMAQRTMCVSFLGHKALHLRCQLRAPLKDESQGALTFHAISEPEGIVRIQTGSPHSQTGLRRPSFLVMVKKLSNRVRGELLLIRSKRRYCGVQPETFSAAALFDRSFHQPFIVRGLKIGGEICSSFQRPPQCRSHNRDKPASNAPGLQFVSAD
jgi:hypothetical protein